MRVLLTGATGFLGSEVLQRLNSREELVTALVRPQNGEANDRLGAVGRSGHIRVVAGGLDDHDAVARACEGAEVVIHLAGVSIPNELEMETVNIMGTRNVADACASSGVRRLVFASSAAVYGFGHSRATGPIDEQAPLLGRLAYARSKAAAEEVVREAARTAGMEWVVLRPELIYGVGAAVFQRIVERVAKHPRLMEEHGNWATLQPIHVRDAAEAFTLAATARGLDGTTLNVAGAQHVPHRAFVRLIKQALGTGATDEHLEPFVLASLKYDIRRARAELGFEPRTSLEQGIPEAVQKIRSPRRRIQDVEGFHARAWHSSPSRARYPAAIGGWWR